jgi:hypothetical protein
MAFLTDREMARLCSLSSVDLGIEILRMAREANASGARTVDKKDRPMTAAEFDNWTRDIANQMLSYRQRQDLRKAVA